MQASTFLLVECSTCSRYSKPSLNEIIEKGRRLPYKRNFVKSGYKLLSVQCSLDSGRIKREIEQSEFVARVYCTCLLFCSSQSTAPLFASLKITLTKQDELNGTKPKENAIARIAIGQYNCNLRCLPCHPRYASGKLGTGLTRCYIRVFLYSTSQPALNPA